jgi:serine/threonine protein kinase
MPRESSALNIPVSVELPASGKVTRGATIDSLVFAEGDVIAGKYRVEKQLAVGGMGVVYACTDTLLDRAVALKVIHPDIAEDESIRERFLLEARTLARLANPHVTRVFECGYARGSQPYIVMEFLEGTDLYSVLRERGPLTAERTVRLAVQVCRGLRAAHAHGIVHRDLKPENLFVTHTQSGAELVKILDFGISKQSRLAGRRTLTNPSMNVGSPHYMAPEQVRSPSSVDGRADIWSLGVVMYEILTGHVPFEGSTLPELCQSVLSDPIPSLGERVSPALAAIVHRCLERDLTRRYADVDELERDLRALVPKRKAPATVAGPSTMVTPFPMEKSILPDPPRRTPGRGQRVLVSLALTIGTAFATYWSLQTGLVRLPETAPHPLLARFWPEAAALPPPVELVDVKAAAPAPPRPEVLRPRIPTAERVAPPASSRGHSQETVAPPAATAPAAPSAKPVPKSNPPPRKPPTVVGRAFAAAPAEAPGAPLELRERPEGVPGSLPEITD